MKAYTRLYMEMQYFKSLLINIHIHLLKDHTVSTSSKTAIFLISFQRICGGKKGGKKSDELQHDLCSFCHQMKWITHPNVRAEQLTDTVI